MLAWLRRCIIDLLDIYLLWHVSRAYQNSHRLLDALYILVKWILHLVTGRSELSRVLTSRTTTAQLARRGEVVLKTSKTLRVSWRRLIGNLSILLYRGNGRLSRAERWVMEGVIFSSL